MQTFLPYPSFVQSAKVLDNKRLGNQRVEVLQLLQALTGERVSAWRNHPAAKMWQGYEAALAAYGVVICTEWVSRGFVDTCEGKILALPTGYVHGVGFTPPPWLGDPTFHASHRSNLLRKMPEWYEQFGWTEPSDLPYVWPTTTEAVA